MHVHLITDLIFHILFPFQTAWHLITIIVIAWFSNFKTQHFKVDIFPEWNRVKLDHLLAVYKNLIQAFNIDHTVYIKPRNPDIVSIKAGPNSLSSLLSPSHVPSLQ